MSRMSDNLNRERSGSKIENEDIYPSSKASGDPGDYYNDDLSRNVVQGLFSSAEKIDKDSYVSGYADEDFENFMARKKARNLEEKNKIKHDDWDGEQQPKDDWDRGYPPKDDRKRERPAKDDWEPEPRPKDDWETDDWDRGRRRVTSKVRSDASVIPRTSKKDAEDIDFNRYRPRERLDEPSRQKSSASPKKGITPAISIADREKRAYHSASPKDTRRAGAIQENDFEESLAYHEDSMSLMKIVAITASVVVLIILAALIFKINSTNSKLEQAMQRLEVYESSENDINQLKMEKEALAENVRLLTEELEEYKAAVVSNTAAGTSDPEDADSEPSETANTERRTYTVKSGDNLSKISTEFYGTVKEVDRIKEANGMQNSNIYVGQTLIIP